MIAIILARAECSFKNSHYNSNNNIDGDTDQYFRCLVVQMYRLFYPFKNVC